MKRSESTLITRSLPETKYQDGTGFQAGGPHLVCARGEGILNGEHVTALCPQSRHDAHPPSGVHPHSMKQQDIDASPWGLSRLARLMACCIQGAATNKDGCRCGSSCGSNILAKSTARQSKLSIQEHFLRDFSSERT